MKNPIIALLTDFGTKDHYVASMKGVILKINPRCQIIDMTHQIHPQNIIEGAFLLSNAFSYFPKGTVHVAVVDPGVGSKRKPILLVTKNYLFIGPDNGVCALAAKKDGIKQIVVLTSQKYFLPEVSATFHGRDIFAPVAGHLSLGLKPSTFGKRTDRWVGLDIGQPKTKRGQLMGEIIHTDRFGNLITNIGQEGFLRFIQSRSFTFKVGKKMIKGLRRGYWEGKRNEPIALFGSGGFLEIAVREGSAQKALKLKRGDQIIVSVKSHQ